MRGSFPAILIEALLSPNMAEYGALAIARAELLRYSGSRNANLVFFLAGHRDLIGGDRTNGGE
jgi:hypothetical protein